MVIARASAIDVPGGYGGATTNIDPPQPLLAKKTGGGARVSMKPAAGSTGRLTASIPSWRTTRDESGARKTFSSSTRAPTIAPFASTTNTPGPVAPGAPGAPDAPMAPKSERSICVSFALHASRTRTAPDFFSQKTTAFPAVGATTTSTPTATHQLIRP